MRDVWNDKGSSAGDTVDVFVRHVCVCIFRNEGRPHYETAATVLGDTVVVAQRPCNIDCVPRSKSLTAYIWMNSNDVVGSHNVTESTQSAIYSNLFD
jgi:hypothetical protein